MSKRLPAEVFPPGEFLLEELEERGWSQADFAEILGRPARMVNEIIQGKRAISPETARGLADALGTSPEYWLNLETAHQLRAVRPDYSVARRAKLYERLPIKDLIRRGWLEPSENIEVLETRVLSFLGVKTLDDAVEPLACAARKSTSYTETTPAQTAWLLRVRRIAETMVVAKRFTEQLFERALTFLRNLMVHEQEARHVPRVLSEAGIRFLIVEHLPHTKIDGVCLWLDASSPVVALSCRFDRIDSFWFTLAHELGHVKHQHGLNAPVKLDADLDGTLLDDECPSEERLANEFASNLLVPSDALQDFMARVRPLYSRQKINGFAAVQRVHPGIVVGQLHGHHEIGYAHSREALTKVRDVVVESALTDGWGNFIPSEA